MSLEPDATVLGPSGPMANLIVKQGPQIGIQFPITGPRVVLGREESTDIIIQDAEVSRRHCQISWEGDGFLLQDINSTNGTFLNGAQITSPKMLADGDSIGLGQTTLIFEYQAADGSEQPYYETYPDTASPAKPNGIPLKERLFEQKNLIIGGCGCLLLLCACTLAAVIALNLEQVTTIIEQLSLY